MYLKVFNGVEDFVFTPVERWATPDRVFDDSYASFRIVGDAFENCPLPIGTKVKMRLIHNFHIRDGLIAREIGYEVWRRAEQAKAQRLWTRFRHFLCLSKMSVIAVTGSRWSLRRPGREDYDCRRRGDWEYGPRGYQGT